MTEDEIATIKWKLAELAAAEPYQIESNDYEIYGEDDQGREGYCTIQINSVAAEASGLIEYLQLRNQQTDSLRD